MTVHIYTTPQNAYTSADETVYQLTVPSVGGDTKLVADALDVMSQFAFHIRWVAFAACRGFDGSLDGAVAQHTGRLHNQQTMSPVSAHSWPGFPTFY